MIFESALDFIMNSLDKFVTWLRPRFMMAELMIGLDAPDPHLCSETNTFADGPRAQTANWGRSNVGPGHFQKVPSLAAGLCRTSFAGMFCKLPGRPPLPGKDYSPNSVSFTCFEEELEGVSIEA